MTPDAIKAACAASAQLIIETAALQAEQVHLAALCIADHVRAGGTIYLIGNGGSAATASHIAGEFVGRFKLERDPLRAFALMTDPAVVTAIANDYGYEYVFARQMAMLNDGDVLIAYTTSGKSANVILSLARLVHRDIIIVVFTGGYGTACADTNPDAIVISVPSCDTPRIQEAHDVLSHCLVQAVDEILANGCVA